MILENYDDASKANHARKSKNELELLTPELPLIPLIQLQLEIYR
jgi:hypothetical protein